MPCSSTGRLCFCWQTLRQISSRYTAVSAGAEMPNRTRSPSTETGATGLATG
jgi:hypothetical protein